MRELLEYRSYYGSINIDFEKGILFGRVYGVIERIEYQAETVKELKRNFEACVDAHILCLNTPQGTSVNSL